MRAGLVLSGGGARGAYEAGALSYLYERIYPELPGFEFDVVSGTSVGAIHAAYTLASAHMDAENRARQLAETWTTMAMGDVLALGWSDLLGVPLRALGLWRGSRGGVTSRRQVIGGLLDVSPLERIVEDRVPWQHLDRNLRSGRGRALCISCTEVRAGRVTVFMDGLGADPDPWDHDPNAQAIPSRITARHVRASAAIPFLFPAVRIGDRYYVDGGLRMNTPLSPVLRLRSDRVLVVSLRRSRDSDDAAKPYPEEVVTQPAFMMGKVLDALTLDQLEYELQRIELVNAMIERGEEAFGEAYLERMNPAVRAQRGTGYRPVRSEILRPSQDLGRMAAECYASKANARSMGVLPRLLARLAKQGVPDDEADLLSYLYFDGCYTSRLVELGREDMRARHDAVLELLASDPEF
ncbi:MAG: patatin-like phospholipase family protein [Deltaproteobacteria bacterium]|nr:patatin-like phospholipase family protein [Deltaproteobacteria bacterium]